MARELGVPLMPWQQYVLDVGMEYEGSYDNPELVYREIIFGTPRQSGKSTVALVKMMQRAMRWSRHSLIYSMQSGQDARRKLMDDFLPAIQDSPFDAALTNVRRASGREMLTFRSGSTIETIATKKSSGHGRIIDEAWLDEAMHDLDDRREQAVQPAMVTRANAQLVITSTAGTDESLFWRRKVDLGRKLVDDGVTEDVCYFEWSFPEDVDPYDEDVWWQYMPALGRTQPISAVRHAAQTMLEDEFRRAFGNMWTRTDERVINWAAWVECRDPNATPVGDLFLAVDVNAERSAAAIVVAGKGLDERIDVELIEHREGLRWIPERTYELVAKHRAAQVLVDGSGPIGALIPELERAGLPLNVIRSGDLARAAGSFYDHILGRRLRVRPSEPLDTAVAGAVKRIRGDAFTWARRTMTGDISPLVAATLAVWGIAGNPSHGAIWLY